MLAASTDLESAQIALRAPLSVTEAVVLNHDENDVSIGYVGIHYANTEGNR